MATRRSGRPGRDPGGGRRRAAGRRHRGEVVHRRPRRRLAVHGRDRAGGRGAVRREDPGRRARQPQDGRRRRLLHRGPTASAEPSSRALGDAAGNDDARRPGTSRTEEDGSDRTAHRRRHRARRHHPARRRRRVDLGGHARRPVRGHPRSTTSGPASSRPGWWPGWPSSRPRRWSGSRPAGWTAASRRRWSPAGRPGRTPASTRCPRARTGCPTRPSAAWTRSGWRS